MKMKKILAGTAAAALAVSAMAVGASAVDIADYFEGSNEGATLYLVADDGKPQWAVDAGVDITTIYGVRFYATFDAAEVADETAWIGGGIGANSNSTGWKSIEWGRNSKAITADLENGTITWMNDAPIFQADDAYAHLWIQDWASKKASYDKVEVLDKDGNVITGEAAAPAGRTYDKTYKATMSFADTAWAAQDWESTVDVTGDGTYTVKANVEGFADFGVFCIDIPEFGADFGVVPGPGEYDMSKVNVSDVKVIVDDSEIPVDMSKVLWGDPEEKGNLRIEIYNQYGKTKDAPAVEPKTSGTTLAVQFTIAVPVQEAETTTEAPEVTEATEATEAATEAPEATEATEATTEAIAASEAATDAPEGNTAAGTSDKNNADTGVEGVAIVAALAVLAGGAVVIAKKRK